ncbi:hypothetical protein BD410DRAFT_781475, partial [Rickenella mellea]
MLRTLITTKVPRTIASSRALHASPSSAFKTMSESVKETAKDVNIKVGQTLASGIEKTQQATESVKETVGAKSKETANDAKHAANAASEKAGQAAAGAKEATEDAKHDVKKHM